MYIADHPSSAGIQWRTPWLASMREYRRVSYPEGHRPGVYGTPAASSCCSNFFSSVSSAFSFAISAFNSSTAIV